VTRPLLFLGMVWREFPVPHDVIPPEPNAPQALLRDLHRVSKKFTVSPDAGEKAGVSLDGGRRQMAAIRRTLTARYEIPITELVPTHQMFKEGYREVKQLVRSDWTQAPKLATSEKVIPTYLAMRDWEDY
jgi:hypothetical protein